jgi:formate-dependent nitrite reductase membrane component NrfD
MFWGGFLGAGLLVPALIELFAWANEKVAPQLLTLLIAGVLSLTGGFLMRLLILAAGIRSPLIVRAPFRVRPGF